MTSVSPPTYYFNGIYYNSSFYESSSSSSSSGGLTQAVANTLYLRKTVPDSALALESFSAGITTNSLDTNTPIASFSMLSSVTGNNIGIGIATGAPAYTGVKTIQIGETTVTSVHAGGIDCTGTLINGAVAPAGGNLSLASSQTSGTLNIGTNAVRSGIINIGTGATNTSASVINIGTGGLSPIVIGNNISNNAQITIGNAGSGSIVRIPCTISSQIMDYAGTMYFGTNATTATIGGALCTTNILGNNINITGNTLTTSGITTSSVNATSSSATLSIGNALTTGILNIGIGVNGTGQINVGTTTTTTTHNGSINASSMKTNAIDNWTGGNMAIGATSTSINLGGVLCTTNILGNNINITGNTLTTSGITTSSVDATGSGATLSIGNALTTGILNIGTGVGSLGQINVGTTTTTTTHNGSINATSILTNAIDDWTGGILSLGATSTSVKILGPTTVLSLDPLAITGNLTIGGTQTSGPLYIGCNSSGVGTRLVAGTINIGKIASLALPINIGGNTSITTIGGTLASTGLITATGGLTSTRLITASSGLSVSGAITLPVASYTPTAGTQLGGLTNGVFATPLVAFSSVKSVASVTVPAVGLYLCTFSFQVNYGTLPTANYIILSGTATGYPTTFILGMSIELTPSAGNMSATFFAPITVAGTITLQYNITGTVNSITQPLFQIVRIA